MGKTEEGKTEAGISQGTANGCIMSSVGIDQGIKEQFDNVLNEIGIKDQVSIMDIYRIRTRNNANYKGKNTHQPCRVTFMNRFQKGIFLTNLKNLDKYKNIKVSAVMTYKYTVFLSV